MNAKRRWYELLLHGMVIILVLSAGNIQSANAQYSYDQGDWEPYTSPPVDYDNGGSTWKEVGYAIASTAHYGTYAPYLCNCTADAHSEANNDRADASADSQATWLTDWTWNGPPESNAPGGGLYWYQVVYDSTKTAAWGHNTTSGASVSSAEGESWSSGTEGSAYADIKVWGLIDDGSISGDWDPTADPYENLTLDPEQEGSYTTPPDYSFWEDGWTFSKEDTETIASGTTYIYFAGGVYCDVDTTTISTELTDPWANAYGQAEVHNGVGATFTPNQ